jgi:hypothetical protein
MHPRHTLTWLLGVVPFHRVFTNVNVMLHFPYYAPYSLGRGATQPIVYMLTGARFVDIQQYDIIMHLFSRNPTAPPMCGLPNTIHLLHSLMHYHRKSSARPHEAARGRLCRCRAVVYLQGKLSEHGWNPLVMLTCMIKIHSGYFYRTTVSY